MYKRNLKGGGDNYQTWRASIRGVCELANREYWTVLTEGMEPHKPPVISFWDARRAIYATREQESTTEVLPNSVSIRDSINGFYGSFLKPNQEHADWVKTNEILAKLITDSIDPSLHTHVSEAHLGSQMWRILADLYGSVKKDTFAKSHNNWVGCVYRPESSCEAFLCRWRAAYREVQELLRREEKIPDSVIFTIFTNAVSAHQHTSSWARFYEFGERDMFQTVMPDFLAHCQEVRHNESNTPRSNSVFRRRVRTRGRKKRHYFCPYHNRYVSHRPEDCRDRARVLRRALTDKKV